MRTFILISLALLATIGAAFDTLAWTRGLDAHNPFVGLVSRAPKGGGGKGGGGGGSSSHGSGDDDDDEDDDSFCTTGGDCPSGQKLCGDYCIPSDGECCGGDTWYCPSSQRCVKSSTVSDYYKCCPESDSSCDAEDRAATFTEMGDYQISCESSGTLVRGGWALGAVGVMVALGA